MPRRHKAILHDGTWHGTVALDSLTAPVVPRRDLTALLDHPGRLSFHAASADYRTLYLRPRTLSLPKESSRLHFPREDLHHHRAP